MGTSDSRERTLGTMTCVNCDCVQLMERMAREGQRVDFVLTSPPYDSMRTYGGATWDYGKFEQVAKGLWNVTADGAVVVWVVGDETIKKSETGTSFRQALRFMELGFRLHDTMIFEKNSPAFPARHGSKRYTQIFEYMFVFAKGDIHPCSLLEDKPNKWAGHTNWGKNTAYGKDGQLRRTSDIKPVPPTSMRNNIWKYTVGFNSKKHGRHPAVFPLQLAIDHIKSWTMPEHVVFDPFLGSGTTMDACVATGRPNFIGCEINPEYFAIIESKMNELEQNPALEL